MNSKTISSGSKNGFSPEDTCSSGKHTVLYIEDNSTNRELVRYILELRSNFIYLEAETGGEGLKLAQNHHPDLILLDINLPDMDGYTVFNRLQDDTKTADIPVIALTGKGPLDEMGKETAGFTKFLSKPIDIKEFHNSLDAIFK